jgi:hypothetical protein
VGYGDAYYRIMDEQSLAFEGQLAEAVAKSPRNFRRHIVSRATSGIPYPGSMSETDADSFTQPDGSIFEAEFGDYPSPTRANPRRSSSRCSSPFHAPMVGGRDYHALTGDRHE